MSRKAAIALQKKFYESYGAVINWPLTRKLELGDVGQWSSGKTFSPDTTLDKLGIEIESHTGSVMDARRYQRAGSSVIQFTPAAKAPLTGVPLAKAKASVNLRLIARYSWLLEARGIQETSVRDMATLKVALAGLRKTEDYWSHRAVIISVTRAETATIALAAGRNQQVGISAGVETDIPFSIADGSLNLQLDYQGTETQVELVARNAVLAFQVLNPGKISRYRRG